MALKLEYINSFLGFGDGNKSGEYFFSQNMRRVGKSLEPRWRMVKSADNSTSSSMYLMDDINWFAEREESGNTFIYAIDTGGDIFKTQDLQDSWSKVSPVFTNAGKGNGLIVDQTSSQRVLFAQDKHLGMYDGVTWNSDWKDFLWDIDADPRPLDTYKDWIVCGNSSTVAILNVTDDSWNAEALTFPKGAKIVDLKSGRNAILVGVNFQNEGALVLWDPETDKSLAPWIWLKGKIKSITKYKGIWIVSAGNEFLVTNGYQIVDTFRPPDVKTSDSTFGPSYPSGATSIKDLFLVNCGEDFQTRRRKGIYIYDFVSRLWEFATAHSEFFTTHSFKALFSSSNQAIYASYDYKVGVSRNCIGRLLSDSTGRSSGEEQTTEHAYVMSPKFGKSGNKKKAKGIVLDYGFSNLTRDYNVPNIDLLVSIYDYQRQLWAYGQTSSTSTRQAEIHVDGTASTARDNAEVGDQIMIGEGVNAGQSKYITEITGEGTVEEKYVLDSNLDDLSETAITFNIIPFKRVGKKTIDSRTIKNNRYYLPIKNSIVGKNFMVKVEMKGTTTTFRLDGLGLLYDEDDLT